MIRKRLPKKRRHTTFKARVNGQKIWVTIGKYDDGTLGEVFVDMAKAGSFVRGMMNCFARLFSFALQYGVPLDVLVSSFRNVDFEPCGDVTDCDGITKATSIPDFVVQLLERECANAPIVGP